MAYRIKIADDAERHLLALTAREQRNLQAAVVSRLTHDPLTPTRTLLGLRMQP